MNAPAMYVTDADHRRLMGLRASVEGAAVAPPGGIPYPVITMHSRLRLTDPDAVE